MKIIGCGNADRGDDQAGIVAAERLRELGLTAEVHCGDALSLLDQWRTDDDVVLIDAVVTGAPQGTVRLWDTGLPGQDFPNAVGGLAVSSHGFDIAKAIELARALGKLPVRLRVYGIEGQQFDRGAKISPAVENAIDLVIQQILAAVSTAT